MTESNFNDLSALADCHMTAFTEAFSTKLGKQYVQKMLEWYLISPKAVLLHLRLENSKKIAGYMALVKNDIEVAGSSTGMFKHTLRELILALFKKPWLIFHSQNFSRINFLFRKIGIAIGLIEPRPSIPVDFKPSLGLVIIGVDKEFQGKGYGAQMLRYMEKVALDLGLSRLSLSVRTNNLQAINAYKRSGWQVIKTHELSLEMEKVLD